MKAAAVVSRNALNGLFVESGYPCRRLLPRELHAIWSPGTLRFALLSRTGAGPEGVYNLVMLDFQCFRGYFL